MSAVKLNLREDLYNSFNLLVFSKTDFCVVSNITHALSYFDIERKQLSSLSTVKGK